MKYKKNIYTSLLFCLLTLFSSCGGGNQSEYFSTILKSEEGHLRGVNIGDNIEVVQEREDAKYLKDRMEDYLHYDYTVEMGNTYTVTYDFSDENKLYEIELAVFFDLIEDAGLLFQDFDNHFTRKYGKGKKADDGFTIWKIENAKTNTEIAMINDSESYGYLSIIIRDLNY